MSSLTSSVKPHPSPDDWDGADDNDSNDNDDDIQVNAERISQLINKMIKKKTISFIVLCCI